MPEDTDDQYLPATEQDVGGFEGLGSEDYKLPFIKLLQQLSPELNPAKGEYNPDARAGMFVNSATAKVYGPKIEVIFCAVQPKIVEWKQGGGFGGSYSRRDMPLDGVQNAKGKLVRPNGNTLEPTMYYFVLVRDEDESVDRGVLSMKGTALNKTARKFNTQLASMTAKDGPNKGQPLAPYTYVYDVFSFVESNSMGSWFGYLIRKGRGLSDSELHLARAFAQTASTAEVQTEGESAENNPVAEPKNF